MAKKVVIQNQAHAQHVMESGKALVIKMLESGPVEVTIQQPSRSAQMNKKFHAMIVDIAKHVVFPPNKRYDLDCWKALLVDAFSKEREAMGEPLAHPGHKIPALDGESYTTVRASTAKFRKQEGLDFIEYLYAFGSEAGVSWSEPALAVYAEWQKESEGKL